MRSIHTTPRRPLLSQFLISKFHIWSEGVSTIDTPSLQIWNLDIDNWRRKKYSKKHIHRGEFILLNTSSSIDLCQYYLRKTSICFKYIRKFINVPFSINDQQTNNEIACQRDRDATVVDIIVPYLWRSNVSITAVAAAYLCHIIRFAEFSFFGRTLRGTRPPLSVS